MSNTRPPYPPEFREQMVELYQRSLSLIRWYNSRIGNVSTSRWVRGLALCST